MYNYLQSSLDNIVKGLGNFGPEMILGGLFLLLIVLDLIFGKRPARPSGGNEKIVPLCGILGIIFSLIIAFGQFKLLGTQNLPLFMSMIVLDKFSVFFKIIFSLAGILAILMSMDYKPLYENSKTRGEYYALLISIVFGMNVMAMSINLIMMYITLELVSIASYIMAVYTRKDYKSAEAGLKYILFGGLSSGSMIYGISLLYGYTGSMTITDPAFIDGLRAIPTAPMMLAGLLVLAGMGYKIAVAPFHFWSPDVYEGAPTPVTAFLAVGPKAAGFAMLIRFVTVFVNKTETWILPWQQFDWVTILSVISMLTMTLGNLAAIWQNNLKRMLAYSSIAHAGYVLMGVVCISQIGFTAVMLYLIIYLLMNLGAFLIVGMIAQKTGSEDVRDYKGIGFKIPFIGACMVLFLLALTGLPPTAGFIGKFYLLWGVVQAWQATHKVILFSLLIVAIVNTVFALFYYFKVPMYMYLKQPARPSGGNDSALEHKFSPLSVTVVALLAIPTLVLGVYFGWLVDFIKDNVLLLY